jgi:hypothetical protein
MGPRRWGESEHLEEFWEFISSGDMGG